MTAADEASTASVEEIHILEVWAQTHAAVEGLTELVYADVAAQTGLARSSFEALWFLYFAPGRSAPMSALSRELRFSTAGITKLIDRLADGGLIRRRPDALDRRVTLAELTAEGARTVDRAGVVLADAVQRRVVAKVGLRRFEELAAMLNELSPTQLHCATAARPRPDSSVAATGTGSPARP